MPERRFAPDTFSSQHLRSAPAIDRRAFLASAAACVPMALAAPVPAMAQSGSGLGSASQFLSRARSFLGQLSPDQRKAASFAWNGREWRNWNYFGGVGLIKPGLRLEQMSAAQQDGAWHMLAAIPGRGPRNAFLSPSSANRRKPARGASAWRVII